MMVQKLFLRRYCSKSPEINLSYTLKEILKEQKEASEKTLKEQREAFEKMFDKHEKTFDKHEKMFDKHEKTLEKMRLSLAINNVIVGLIGAGMSLCMAVALRDFYTNLRRDSRRETID